MANKKEMKISLQGLEDLTEAELESVKQTVFEAALNKVNEILAGRAETPIPSSGGRRITWSWD